jgi:hypothetical protein
MTFGRAFVGPEANTVAGLRVEDPVSGPAEVTSVEAKHFVVLDVGSCFATPEINCFFVRCNVSGWLALFVVECGFHCLLPECRGYDGIGFSLFGQIQINQASHTRQQTKKTQNNTLNEQSDNYLSNKKPKLN